MTKPDWRMAHRSVAGEIRYTTKKPEHDGAQRGREWFRFTRHTDGKVTLRAHCEIWEPAPTVLRDVVYALDEHRRPMDCSVRLTIGDKFLGSGWFRFAEDMIECESYGPTIGRLSQRVPLSAPLEGFGTHPVVADGYLLSVYDWAEGERRTLNLFLPSPDHRGATAPMISPVKIDAHFLGREEITVAAGRFATKRFQFIDPGDSGLLGEHPRYDIWITDDEDGVMVQGGVGGYMQTWYELVSLER